MVRSASALHNPRSCQKLLDWRETKQLTTWCRDGILEVFQANGARRHLEEQFSLVIPDGLEGAKRTEILP